MKGIWSSKNWETKDWAISFVTWRQSLKTDRQFTIKTRRYKLERTRINQREKRFKGNFWLNQIKALVRTNRERETNFRFWQTNQFESK